jgi:hypothetical protein
MEHLFELLGGHLSENLFALSVALEHDNDMALFDIDTGNFNAKFCPFVVNDERPSIFSFYHLVYQSMKRDHVSSPLDRVNPISPL